ncbi:MAG: aspartate-semialdehyde dehydrogenase [Deltaproteobacteria bacterium]|nr:aspartate-semialdehyde dehydrogenase [Deltaproteobacteria bacterium]MBI3388636.1 aspartate-semialdehyde dehydrogenase [Deltaproteobacteria bacterium]
MSRASYNVAVVGATGLVGAEILTVLAEREFPLGELTCYASERTAGDDVSAGSVRVVVELLARAEFHGVDIVFFATPEQITAEWAGRATAADAVVIDLSRLYAEDVAVPLVVSEVNAAVVAEYSGRRIIASPDAAVVQLAAVLKPLRDAAGLKRVVVSSYQPVSDAGRAGLDALSQQTVALLNGQDVVSALFPHRVAFNVFPQVGEFLDGGYTRAEQNLMAQTRRVLDDPALAMTATSVRVPLFYGLSQSVNVETTEPLSAAAAREVLRSAPGVLVQDDAGANEYPTPMTTIGGEATCVGRIRDDESVDNGLNLWIVGDNLRKGAALNAVAIAEILIREYL